MSEKANAKAWKKSDRMIPKWAITNESLLPDKYWQINMVLLSSEIRGGIRDIPGVQIRMEPEIVKLMAEREK